LRELLRILFTILEKVLDVNFAWIGMFTDQRIQCRLRELRIISFIVSMPAIADHVDEHICVELLAILHRDLGTFHYGFGIVAIHMKYGGLYRCGKRGTVIGTPCIVEVGCESNLVVDHEVNRSTSVISFEVAHLQHFVHDALPCERSITMNENRKNLVVLRFIQYIGLRS